MKIKFCGASIGVTGSCHLLTTDNHKILLDCGQFQGGKEMEKLNDRRARPDAVVLWGSDTPRRGAERGENNAAVYVTAKLRHGRSIVYGAPVPDFLFALANAG